MSQFWIGILGGFSGAALGVLGAEIVKFILEPGKRLESRRNEILAGMLDEITTIERDAAAYWNGEHTSNSPEIHKLEQNIKVSMHGLTRDAVDLFEDNKRAKDICEKEIRALRILTTGGDFGDAQQLKKPNIALEIRTKCSDVRRALRNQRHTMKRRFI